MIAATILGTLVGIGRLSQNWIVRKISTVYVEVVRNIPLALFLVDRPARRRARRVPEHQRGLGLPRAGRPVEPWPRRAVVRRWQRARAAPDPARSAALALVGASPGGDDRCRTARARRRGRACGAGSRSSWSWSSVWFAFGYSWSVPGDRGAGDERRDAGRSVVLRPVLRPRDLHRQPHRRDRARLDPGGAARSGRGGRRGRPQRVPEDVVRRPAAGAAHRHPAARQPVPQPDQELLARRGDRLLRPHARRQDDGRQRIAGRAGVRARRCSCTSSLSLVASFIVNVANRRMALVER